jgi:hypothetical protein
MAGVKMAFDLKNFDFPFCVLGFCKNDQFLRNCLEKVHQTTQGDRPTKMLL